MQAGESVTLFVLDACRNNPYISALATRGVPSAPRGLAPVEATSGTFVMFSAASGEEALDSLATDPPSEKNSLYTHHLVALVSDGRLSLQSMAQNLREMVGQAAKKVNHRQTPAYFDGLVGTVCLVKDCQAVAARQ